jgi:hypothetical protein
LIHFEIPIRTPLLNVWQRMHWAKRSRLAKDIAWAVKAALPRKMMPARPLKQCVIHVERESTREPDFDGMVGGLKPLLDALQPASKRHPLGLGIIADDSPRCLLHLTVRHLAGKGSRTIVRIEEP